MKLEEGQLIKFSYMGEDAAALLGIVTKVDPDKINILWNGASGGGAYNISNGSHTVSYEDFEHAMKNGVYEIVEEST